MHKQNKPHTQRPTHTETGKYSPRMTTQKEGETTKNDLRRAGNTNNHIRVTRNGKSTLSRNAEDVGKEDTCSTHAVHQEGAPGLQNSQGQRRMKRPVATPHGGPSRDRETTGGRNHMGRQLRRGIGADSTITTNAGKGKRK